jgi:hypothetical protein
MLADALILPLDRARSELFRVALALPGMRWLLLRKRRRVPALLLLHTTVALFLAMLAPTLLLLAGPLLLGVPHLVSDVRYLVLRPVLKRSTQQLLLGGSALLLLVQLARAFGLHASLRVELGIGWLFVLCVTLSSTSGAKPWRLASLLGLWLTFAVVQWFRPGASLLGLAHGHNLLALAFWAFGFAAQRRVALVGCGLVLALAAALVATPAAWWGYRNGLTQVLGLSSWAAADGLAPFVRSPTLALGVVSAFAFLQSVHYAVWLHAVPQEATRGEGTLTFRMSLRQLRTEVGRRGAACLLLLFLVVPLVATLLGAVRTKELYLSLSAFHAYLELAAGAFWVALGQRPVALASGASPQVVAECVGRHPATQS